MMVGLDIGTSNIIAVIGEVLPDGVVNVLGRGCSVAHGVDRGGIVDLNAVVKSIESAISEVESAAESLVGSDDKVVKIEAVTLSISGEHIQALNQSSMVTLENRVVTQKDIDKAVIAARGVRVDHLDILHALPQEYRVDNLLSTKNPLGLAGMHLTANVHLIACHKSWLQNLKNAVARAGLKVDQVVFSGFASSYSVLTEEEKELGVCLIDIGGGTMDILVYTDGAVRFSKVIPFGGNNVTGYLAEALRANWDEAENIKISHGSAVYPANNNSDKRIEVRGGVVNGMSNYFTKDNVSQVTAHCYNYLMNYVNNELIQLRYELSKRGIKQELIAGFVLTGGGSQIEDIVECAKSVFGSHVRVGYPLNITGLTEYVNKPQYATVLGLLQYNHHNVTEVSKSDILPPPVDDMLGRIKNIGKWIKKEFGLKK